MAAPRITASDLDRRVRALNVKHNVDAGEPCHLYVEQWRRRNSQHLYAVMVRTGFGQMRVTRWNVPKDVITELGEKDWQRILLIACVDRLSEPEAMHAGCFRSFVKH